MHRIKIIENFISPEDAEILISQQNDPFAIRDPYPDYYADRFGGTSLPYNKTVMDIMVKYGNLSNEVHREQNSFVNPIYVFKGFGSHWIKGTKGGLHIDAQGPEPFIEFSTILYLNEEPDYSGGKIYFPNQNFEYQPKKYSAVFFPGAGSEYIHGITTVTEGHRYTALFMHTSMPQHADPDFLGEDKSPQWEAMRYPLAKL